MTQLRSISVSVTEDASHLGDKACLGPLGLGGLAGVHGQVARPRETTTPEHTSTSPGSLSDHWPVASNTGLCHHQEAKQSGPSQVPGHRPWVLQGDMSPARSSLLPIFISTFPATDGSVTLPQKRPSCLRQTEEPTRASIRTFPQMLHPGQASSSCPPARAPDDCAPEEGALLLMPSLPHLL